MHQQWPSSELHLLSKNSNSLSFIELLHSSKVTALIRLLRKTSAKTEVCLSARWKSLKSQGSVAVYYHSKYSVYFCIVWAVFSYRLCSLSLSLITQWRRDFPCAADAAWCFCFGRCPALTYICYCDQHKTFVSMATQGARGRDAPI